MPLPAARLPMRRVPVAGVAGFQKLEAHCCDQARCFAGCAHASGGLTSPRFSPGTDRPSDSVSYVGSVVHAQSRPS